MKERVRFVLELGCTARWKRYDLHFQYLLYQRFGIKDAKGSPVRLPGYKITLSISLSTLQNYVKYRGESRASLT